MKKRIAVLVFVVMVISVSLTVLAGDIPESLLHSENAQIFFGEVLTYHSDEANPQIGVSVVAVIKGNIKEGTEQIYAKPNPMGDFNVQKGKVYLFAYYDEVNPTDIFEVTTYDTRTLKLKHVEGSMWERFENYLNEGKYGVARIEGMKPEEDDTPHGVIGAVVFISIIGVVMIYKMLKKKNAE